MLLEPEAHFGRAKWHRALVVHLRDVAADPSLARKSFVGPQPTEEQLMSGSHATYAGDDYAWELDMASRMQKDYAFWERTRVAGGLPVWRGEGVKVIYDKQHWFRRRCLAPEVIRDARAPEGELPLPPKKRKAPNPASLPVPVFEP